MRVKSSLLRLAAAGAVVLSAAATAVPSSAAAVAPLKASSGTLSTHVSSTVARAVSPDSAGSIICHGDLCIQRVTSVVNGVATVEAWADGYTFTGHFELSGPDGFIANYPSSGYRTWVAGGTGAYFSGLAQDVTYTITAWSGTGAPYGDIGQVSFGI
ncbi:hypothetical protein KDK95_16380 [Actinospica sp. MGRD01-02]|uniref:Uncharacterized protein n=1 Tax=Actinospica acidithermotolerans TaxID=2828514 RepID=A0A941EAD1_9ACTN|nr:hypothetical protein [Actinospica acidithermotolerans]MBR7827896.1 hypothetical protein [Actinospica acidithermotolerans]